MKLNKQQSDENDNIEDSSNAEMAELQRLMG